MHTYQGLANFVSKHESHIHAMLESHSLTPQSHIKFWRRPGDLEINYSFNGQYRATLDCPCSFPSFGGCSIRDFRRCVNGGTTEDGNPSIYLPSWCRRARAENRVEFLTSAKTEHLIGQGLAPNECIGPTIIANCRSLLRWNGLKPFKPNSLHLDWSNDWWFVLGNKLCQALTRVRIHTGWHIWLVKTSRWLCSESSGSWWAAAVASYCPGRMA